MTRLFRIITLVFALLAVTAGFNFAQASEEKHTFALLILDELSGSALAKMITDVVGIVSTELGIESEVIMKEYSRGDDTFPILKESFVENQADFGLAFSEDYVQLVKKNDQNPVLRPLAILSMDKKKYSQMCVYVREDSAYESVKDLKQTRYAGSSAWPTRHILLKNGFEGSLFDFFSDVKFISDTNIGNMIEATLNNEVDSFIVNKASYRMAKKGPEAAGIKKLECYDYNVNFMVVANSDVPTELMGKVRSLFLKAHKEKAFGQFHFLFRAIDGQFVPVEKGDLDATRENVKNSIKYEWIKDDIKLSNMN